MKSSKQQLIETVVGLDLGDRKTAVTELDASSGDVVCRYSVPTTREGLASRFENRERVTVALEVGKQSPWISRALSAMGHDVVVANARKLRAIYTSDTKTDRSDADMLARIARADRSLLFAIEHRSEPAQIDLSLIRARECLVRTRTRLVNHVRGAVKSFGGKIRSCSSRCFASVALDSLPMQLRHSLDPLIAMISTMTDEIRDYDKRIEQCQKTKYPECELFRAIQGVGPITALTFRLVIDDASRFKSSRSVGAYLGLAPKQRQSGDRNAQLGITKSGDKMTRQLLVQASQYIMGPFGPDTDLRRHGERIAAVGGAAAKRRAVVAVARKLAVLMHRLWIRGEMYQPVFDKADAAA